MKKKLFLWYSGTGTTASDMQKLFDIRDSNVSVLYVDGIGTGGNRTEAQTMAGGKVKGTIEKLANISTRTGALYDSAVGYQEKHHLAQIDHWFTLLEKLKPNEEAEVVIGGHSRGAAGGILGMIASLYALAQNGINFDNSPIKKITLIPVDPVPGPNGNDLMGLETLPKENIIATMLSAISGNNKDFFQIIYYPARFDARNEFKADNYWLDFYKKMQAVGKGQKTYIKTERYIAGFRHSAMVYSSEEISGLYSNNQGPVELLKQIVKTALGIPDKDIALLYRNIQATEKQALADLRAGNGNESLKKRTTKDSYGRVEGYTIYSGKSLEEIVYTNKPDLSKEVIVNNRYLSFK